MAILNNREIDDIVSRNDANGILNWLLTNPTYLNLPYMLAQNKVVPLTCGDTILFDSEDKELLRDLNIWSDTVLLREKLRQIVFQMSLLGKSIAFLERKKPNDTFKNGLLMFKVANLPYMSSVAKIDDLEQIAVIYTNAGKSDSPTLQRIIFKPGEMTVEELGDATQLRAQIASGEVQADLIRAKKKETFKIDINFMPFVEFVNKTMPHIEGLQNQTYFTSIPDWFLGRKLIFDVEDNLEKRKSERTKNQTRIFGQFDNEMIAKIGRGETDLQDVLGDMFLQANTSNYMTGANAITTIQGDPKLEVYHIDKEQTIKTFYESAGYNYLEKDGNYENKEKSIMNYDLDIQTTKMKQADLKQRLYKMLDFVLKDMGHEPIKDGVRVYTIDLVSTSIVQSIQLLDLVDRRLQNGTLEPVRAIQLLDKVDNIRAQEYFDRIQAHIDTQQQKQLDFEAKQNEQLDNSFKDEIDSERDVDGV